MANISLPKNGHALMLKVSQFLGTPIPLSNTSIILSFDGISVLEYGSGNSSLYYLRRGAKVVSS
jgi:hypothetical protein